jgi:hypothetical protein
VGSLVSANVFFGGPREVRFKTGFATSVGVGCLGISAASVFLGVGG